MFLVERNRTDAWSRHVDFVADTFGDLVAGWQPVDETNYYAMAAYRGGGWPPGHDDGTRRPWSTRRSTWPRPRRPSGSARPAPVASIFGLSAIVAQDEDPDTVRLTHRLHHTHWATGLGFFNDGVLRVRGREPVERPDLARAFDLIGFSYYAAMGVREGRLAVHPPQAPTSPLGYGVWADGVGLVLDRLHAEVPDTPLLVAEYGIGTADDEVRADYLERGLQVVHAAIGRGVDVRGLFHWTGVDNYEWSTATTWTSGSSIATAGCDPARSCCNVRLAAELDRETVTRGE
ncbi:MAG: family 1 glycosylhydrolase [Acidimicrobiales bacterium]